MNFDWDDANRAHIARHGVTPEEAEQVLTADPLDIGSEYIEGEQRFVSLGWTRKRRFLVVVTTLRGVSVRVVTAFPANKRLVERFFLEKSL